MTEHRPSEGVQKLTELDKSIKALEKKALLLVRDCMYFEKDEKNDARYASGTKRWAQYVSQTGWMIDILHAIRSDMFVIDLFLHHESKTEEDKLWAFDYFTQFQEYHETETENCRLEHNEQVTEKISSML